MLDKGNVLDRLLAGLAAGDSLGSTTEFCTREQVLRAYADHKDKGWPWRQVGGGPFGWAPGEPTDDSEMAMCMARSHRELGRFDGEDVARRFVEWMDGGPRDIGGTTARTLRRVAAGTPWHDGGLADFQSNPANAANGSLMRNGIVSGLAGGIDDAYRISLHHGIITHYAPLPVLCCALQVYLIDRLLLDQRPFDDPDWLNAFRESWTTWCNRTDDTIVRGWSQIVKADIEGAWQLLTAAKWDVESFDPFEVNYAGRAGYCLLTLQIGMWALRWSVRDDPFPVPTGLPAAVFERREGWTLAWVPLVGEDADTYGATAGPMLAAIHGTPVELTDGLMILQ